MHRLIASLYNQFYTNFSWAYDLAVWIGTGGLWYRWTFVAERYLAADPVVEVGFGRGRLLTRLVKKGREVVGIDSSQQMVRAAKRQLRSDGATGLLVHGRAQALPFPDASVGTLITTFPTSFVRDPATLREFARVLRLSGCWYG
ncbi:MAG: class I SAM-dependent methyltransferase [Planctomycetota bacterium]|jgi:ubiquinone/menaquinone biosynthesis C-methylase UbiE|nr:class I SAM-dependent methyltransferase [Planctomycetota bacterium]MDP7398778.1 class I SAM-dependent methyltransferase [Lentisphaeria bacterium]